MTFRTGLSALQATQFAINNISQNLANASTEGYHRQEVGLQTSRPTLRQGQFVGAGIEISGVRRLRDQVVESSLTNSISDLSQIDQRLLIETRLESFFLPGEGSIQNSLTGVFDELARLSANPGESTLRTSVLNEAVNLASRIENLSDGLVDLRESVGRQIELEVDALNQEIETLVDLQNRIRVAQVNATPNDLLDQRDQLVNTIAQRIDIQRFEATQGGLGLSIAGNTISLGSIPIRFETATGPGGDITVRVEGSDRDVQFTSGRIAALTDVHNRLIGQYQNRADEFASQLIQQFDQVHATGVGLNGSFSLLRGTRLASDIDVPLSEAGFPFPIEQGQLFVSVISPDGERATSTLTIDPAVDSLREVAQQFSGVENLQGVVDENTGLLTIIATPGFQFDFSGTLETIPSLDTFTGSTVPRIGGDYERDSNQTLFVEALGSGQIGVTPGLVVQVSDTEGRIIGEINIGDQYEAGSAIDLGDGITIRFSPGNINLGDSLDAALVAQADTTGILAAIGLNSFFEGQSAQDIAVSTRIIDDPNLIATSTTGDVADTTNLQDLITLGSERVFEDRLTFDDFLAETSSEIGFLVQASTSIQTGISELNFQFETDRASVSGVDVNEELLRLNEFQRSFEAAVQVVRTFDTILDDLFRIIR